MSTNPYKAFTPYLCTPTKPAGILADYAVTDPTAGSWRHVGLAPAFPGETFIVDLQGAARIMAVQFNERILPGKVRDEQLAEVVAKVQERDGRKVSKKEYAQLREQVEFDLLPKAFIRRTLVPIIFIKRDVGEQFMLICTSSAKRADDCVELLTEVFPDMQPVNLSVADSVQARLRTLAVEGWLPENGINPSFFSHDSIVLKGDEKKVIRIKDKSIEDSDVQDLLLDEQAAYSVAELGIAYSSKAELDDIELTFVVNQHLVFKRIVTEGIKPTLMKEDLYGYAVLCAQTYKGMLVKFIEAFGGLDSVGSDDDEEL